MTEDDWNTSDRILVLFGPNFSSLSGILCMGYYLHPSSLPIVRSSKNPEKTGRDVFIAYLMTFLCYAVCGCLGYIGYLGYSFKDDFV